MSRQELRAELRILVTRRGALEADDQTFPCMVQDMSDSGMQIMCNRFLDKGQTLGFRCQLFPEQELECRIEIVHVTDEVVGAKIVSIDESGAKLLALFLQEQFSDRLNSNNAKRWD